VACVGLGLCFSIAVLIWLRRKNRVPDGPPLVEEVHVVGPILGKAEEVVSEGPLYFFEAGDGTILFLHGQWMFDPTVFADPDADPDRFPSTEFRFVLEPETGIVLRVAVLGEPLEPNQVFKRGVLSIPPLANGSRFKGALGALQEALYEADVDHVLRRPRRM
jgi:hypothetical protein